MMQIVDKEEFLGLKILYCLRHQNLTLVPCLYQWLSVTAFLQASKQPK